MKYLLMLLIATFDAVVVFANKSSDGNNRVDILKTYSARSLVQLSHDSCTPNSFGPHDTLEVEEIYDGGRQLGKTLIYTATGRRIELYARPNEGLYLEAQFDVDGSMVSCQVSQQRAPTSDYFELFNELAEIGRSEGATYLIGPSALVHRFRNELPARWTEQAAADVDEPNNSTGDDDGDESKDAYRKELGDRRRLIVDPYPIEFTLDGSSSGTRDALRNVTFKRSDFFIERSPMLSQLAAYISYADKKGRKFEIDLLSLDEIDLAPGLSAWDPFHLPTGFGCGSDGLDSIKGRAHRLDEWWSSKLSISSDWMSATLYGADLPADGAHLAANLASGLMQITIQGSSTSVVDTKRAIIYHKPNERAFGSEQDAAAEMKVNNAECSIMSVKPFLAPTNSDSTRISSTLDRWHFLVGHTNSMIYLGRIMYQDRRLAHEFQLAYDSIDKLPAYFCMLTDLCASRPNIESGQVLAANFWLADNCATADMYSMESMAACDEAFTVLGYRVELTSGADSKHKMQIYWSKEIQLVEFQWALEEDGISERPFKVFDLSQCPLNKVHLTLDIKWMEALRDVEVRAPELDDLVVKELTDYTHGLHDENLHIVGLQKQTATPHGAKVARYLVELAQYPPSESIAFETLASAISKQSIIGEPLDELSGRQITLIECLGWASQFSQAKAVLYSSAENECHIHSSTYRYQADQNSGEYSQGQYTLFSRQVATAEGVTVASNDILRLFLNEHLDSINSELRKNSKKPNKLEASVNGDLVARDIRFLYLKVAPGSSSAPSVETQTGYRFANIDQSECVSLVQCQSHCELEPGCDAFAYCRYPDTGHEFCQLNITKTTSGVDDKNMSYQPRSSGSELTRDAGCEIHAKNYLHYFERLKLDTELWGLDTANGWHPVSNTSNHMDCARACYSLPDNLCMRFIYCPISPKETQHKCLVWLEDPGEAYLRAAKIDTAAKASLVSHSECSIFKRASVSLYQRTLESKANGFVWRGDDHLSQTTLQNVDTERCAERCTENTECQSFDSCLVVKSSSHPRFSMAFTSVECVLLSGSIYDAEQMYLNLEPEAAGDDEQIAAGKVAENRRQCNHYERAEAKRRLSSKEAETLIKSLANGSLPVADARNNSARTSRVGSLFVAALLGLALGLAVNAVAALWRSTKRTGLAPRR